MKTPRHLAAGIMLTSLFVYADGGAVVLRKASGPFFLTVFMASEPLRVGSIDTSVLVQDRETGGVLLDTTVNLVFQPVASTSRQFLIRATHNQAKNKLLQAATLDVPAPGWWTIQVFVQQGTKKTVVASKIFVMPAAPRLTTIWPFLLFPPLAVSFFTVHRVLRRARRR